MDDEFSAEAFQKARQQRIRKERLEAEAAEAADPELAAIRRQTSQAQQETVESSRAAVRQLKETVEMSDATRAKLHQQGEQLSRIEQTAERTDENAQQSYESARDLHKHKGLLPFSVKQLFTGKKKKKEDKDLEKKSKALDRELEGREADKMRQQQQQSQDPRLLQPTKQYADEKEQEIDENLDEMSSGLATLKAHALEMNEEIDKQNVSMKRTEAYVEHTDYTLNSANRKIKEFL